MEAERIAVLNIPSEGLTREQSQGFVQALTQACRAEPRFVTLAENTLATYLQKRRQFSILVADSAQALCKNLALDYLIVSSLELNAASDDAIWQVTLRWLDGSTGQITKIYTQDCHGNPAAPDLFPLQELLSNLLESPNIIVPFDNPPAEASLSESALAIHPIAGDSLTMKRNNPVSPPSQIQTKSGRAWWWYFSGVALISGGSAAFLLKNSAKSQTPGKTLLPEPPDPPK
ncbi:MAG: hypothetical protein ALAOOOJD_00080 [bacterium]|nr:hypothetical protein [bacterium]